MCVCLASTWSPGADGGAAAKPRAAQHSCQNLGEQLRHRRTSSHSRSASLHHHAGKCVGSYCGDVVTIMTMPCKASEARVLLVCCCSSCLSHFSPYTPTRPGLVLERPTVSDVTRKRATRLLRLAAAKVFSPRMLPFHWSCLVTWPLASGIGGVFKTFTSVVNIYWPVWVFTHRAALRDSRAPAA